jgi:hypothetical protein
MNVILQCVRSHLLTKMYNVLYYGIIMCVYTKRRGGRELFR